MANHALLVVLLVAALAAAAPVAAAEPPPAAAAPPAAGTAPAPAPGPAPAAAPAAAPLPPPPPAPGTGSIQGTVSFEGAAPLPQPVASERESKLCGAAGPILSESLLVSPERRVAHVVVVVENAPAAAAPAPATTLQLKGCSFAPHVQSVTAGSTLAIANADPMLHNVHAYLGPRTVFNLGVPAAGNVKKRLDEAGVLRLRSDSGHPWMRGFLAVVPHRFHATTDAGGAFQITGLPPGEYRLRFWHERLGTAERAVTVAAGGAADASVAYPGSALEEEGADEAGAVERRLARVQAEFGTGLARTRSELGEIQGALTAERRARIAAEGRPLYLSYCATCHGPKGDGNGPSARFLEVAPRDFTRGEYKWRLTPSGSLPREEDLYRTITVGVLGTPMPAWRDTLTDGERRLLAQYLMTFSERFATEKPGPAIVIPEEPPASPESAARGATLFVNMGCTACHGPGGKGDGPVAAALVDGWGRPVRPADLTRGWVRGGKGGAVIYRAISTGLSGSPMPSFESLLDPAQRWDLVHHVETLREERSLWDWLAAPAGRITPP